MPNSFKTGEERLGRAGPLMKQPMFGYHDTTIYIICFVQTFDYLFRVYYIIYIYIHTYVREKGLMGQLSIS